MQKMQMNSKIDINVSPQWFSQIKNGKKKVEGRLHKGKFAALKKGHFLIITKDDQKHEDTIVCIITNLVKYPSFQSYLVQEGLSNTLPGVKTIDDGIQIYRNFYSEEKEKENGVLAIHFHKIS